MEEQIRGAVQAIPKSVKKTVVSDIAAIVCMCAALIFMVVFSLVILPKQIQTPQSDNVTGAVVQGFALGLAQAVKIVISVLFAIAYFVIAVVGTVMLIRSRQLARKVFCEGKCFGRYRGSLIAVAVTGGLLFADTLIYVCLYGVTADAAVILAFLAAAAMYLSFALKLRALERKKREKAASEYIVS